MIELLYEALNSPLGVIVESSNVEAVKARLYNLRRQDPALACLSLLTSPTNPTGEIWIVKNETRPDETHPEPSSG
jgi:hypothetical protein